MKYAVIEIGGKQMLVEEGKYYAINRLPHKAGSSLNINRILFCNDKGRRVVGHPYIENLESWVNQFSKSITSINQEMKKIDHKGSFESDDEVGYFYTELKRILNQLNNLGEDE